MATIQNPIELTMYLVGDDEEEALSCMPFDSAESAESYRRDQSDRPNIYSVTAYIDLSTIEQEDLTDRRRPPGELGLADPARHGLRPGPGDRRIRLSRPHSPQNEAPSPHRVRALLPVATTGTANTEHGGTNMSVTTATIKPRVRLIRAAVLVALADGAEATTEVSFRYPWPEGSPAPSHSCVASMCAKCLDEAERLGTRRITGRAMDVTILRDRQAVGR